MDGGTFNGTIRGRTIELETDPGFSEGQTVTVTLRPTVQRPPSDECLRRAFGGWAEDADELDQFLEMNRRLRRGTP